MYLAVLKLAELVTPFHLLIYGDTLLSSYSSIYGPVDTNYQRAVPSPRVSTENEPVVSYPIF